MSELGIRELLWEWSIAYPERAGDAVSWPRMAAFGREMVSGHRVSPLPVNEERAQVTDATVLVYLNAITMRRDREKAELERLVFWLRYYYRWELQDVARKVKKSKPWVEKMCQIVEATVEAFYLARNAA
ncbi:hypothetical protein [Microbulbifer sp. GL-2]|uniref:hypothetical protein n=1 Tax=Microbulbifer sp. GL-2 TaxID=2591606 RepID=UPI0011632A88|nr:hypothetical protein [Microbulbifer sp. GL-2]BBM03949.1 hypothetical protein GL2_40230 [Microbulbifer sp. GL-2]